MFVFNAAAPIAWLRNQPLGLTAEGMQALGLGSHRDDGRRNGTAYRKRAVLFDMVKRISTSSTTAGQRAFGAAPVDGGGQSRSSSSRIIIERGPEPRRSTSLKAPKAGPARALSSICLLARPRAGLGGSNHTRANIGPVAQWREHPVCSGSGVSSTLTRSTIFELSQ